MTYSPLWSEEVEARIRAEARNLDRQERPEHVQQCTRCVISNQRPRIVFDEKGVCSACRYAERKRNEIDWLAREQELDRLLHRHRRNEGYDVIVPCSGGKDSASVAWRLKHDWDMHPLCVTWAPFLYTDVGWRNFQNFVQSGFDAITCFPNGIIHRKLARLSLEFYGDPFIPFIYGQLCWPMQAAYRFGVQLVFGAENGEATYGGDPSANDKPCWDTAEWERVYMKGVGLEKLIGIGRKLGAFTKRDIRELSPFYSLPSVFFSPMPMLSASKDNAIDRSPGGITWVEPGQNLDVLRPGLPEYHWLAYYVDHHPQANFYLASEQTGFTVNEERSEGTYSRYASLDDKLDGLHYYFGYLKFGIGRATSDAAHEVRDLDLERDEALALVAKYDGEFPERHMDECLNYLGMDREQLGRVIERFNVAGVPTDRAA